MNRPSLLQMAAVFVLFLTIESFNCSSVSAAPGPSPQSVGNQAHRANGVTKQNAIMNRGIFYLIVTVGGSIAAWIGMMFVRANDRKSVQSMRISGMDATTENELSEHIRTYRPNQGFRG